jgi:hypothetical protein
MILEAGPRRLARLACRLGLRERTSLRRIHGFDLWAAIFLGTDGGVKPSPSTKFGVRDHSVGGRALAGSKGTAFERLDDGFPGGDNAGAPQAPVCPVGKPVGGVGGAVVVRPTLGQGRQVDAGPATKLPVRGYAVIGRPAIGAEFCGLEGADDGVLVQGEAGLEEETDCPLGEAV